MVLPGSTFSSMNVFSDMLEQSGMTFRRIRPIRFFWSSLSTAAITAVLLSAPRPRLPDVLPPM
jgi:hypothetical protein